MTRRAATSALAGLLLASLLALAAEEAAAQPLQPRATPVARSQRFGGSCQECDLSNRAIPGVRIEQGDFTRARFVRAFLAHMNADGSTFAGADFSLANLVDASIADTRSDGAKFSGADMRRVDASRAQLTESDFANADLDNAVFVQARINGASFAGAQASRVNFLRADLRDASFVYARLQNADFTQADLHGARFQGANLEGADLAAARGLTAAQLRGACGDAATRLPAGLRVPACKP